MIWAKESYVDIFKIHIGPTLLGSNEKKKVEATSVKT